ncbi:MAG: hypothetical protein GY696_09460 [Gammaproteobacteria bacterium]|nr:hypothetical protein [Gammaproteobacteria bacterium]
MLGGRGGRRVGVGIEGFLDDFFQDRFGVIVFQENVTQILNLVPQGFWGVANQFGSVEKGTHYSQFLSRWMGGVPRKVEVSVGLLSENGRRAGVNLRMNSDLQKGKSPVFLDFHCETNIWVKGIEEREDIQNSYTVRKK